MSLFLVYFEPSFKPLQAVSGPLRSSHTTVTVLGSQKPISYPGLVITDGHSSERFLADPNGKVGQAGEALRLALASYLGERVNAGARPRLFFTTFRGPVQPVSVRCEKLEGVTISNLAKRILTLGELHVLEVGADKVPSGLDLLMTSIDSLLPDDLVSKEVARALATEGNDDSESVVVVGATEIRIPKNVIVEVLSKTVIKDSRAVSLAPFRVRVAIGGLVEDEDGEPRARYCFATLSFDADRHVVAVEFQS